MSEPSDRIMQEAESVTNSVYALGPNSTWFDARDLLSAALSAAEERGKQEERDRCQMIVRDHWPVRASILAAIMGAKEAGDE